MRENICLLKVVNEIPEEALQLINSFSLLSVTGTPFSLVISHHFSLRVPNVSASRCKAYCRASNRMSMYVCVSLSNICQVSGGKILCSLSGNDETPL